jgi:DNA-binding PadR family transcriptional regulator
MSSFSDKGLLGELEQLVLLAMIRVAGDERDAYAVSIRDAIETHANVALAPSSVYVTLDRLERKGYARSWMAAPTNARGGKAKRCFEPTAAGRRALTEAERAVSRLRAAAFGRSPR